ncbi:hypothetical protein MTR67_026690 [Solanum verrucosum]|uniref:Uncharacterized protein n=1 Tax=Solanum verrucosum TaxID=315347 RepID=A0AAF0R2R9_SOLVR|nr:hypothetical protein MTR67_026690 [Solanum verrucosum]
MLSLVTVVLLMLRMKGSKSSLVSYVKAKQDLDPNIIELKQSFFEKPSRLSPKGKMVFFVTKNEMKKDITEFVAKCPNCQQVKVVHQKLGGLAHEIGIPIWKWEDLNMDFIMVLPHTRYQFD